MNFEYSVILNSLTLNSNMWLVVPILDRTGIENKILEKLSKELLAAFIWRVH